MYLAYERGFGVQLGIQVRMTSFSDYNPWVVNRPTNVTHCISYMTQPQRNEWAGGWLLHSQESHLTELRTHEKLIQRHSLNILSALLPTTTPSILEAKPHANTDKGNFGCITSDRGNMSDAEIKTERSDEGQVK